MFKSLLDLSDGFVQNKKTFLDLQKWRTPVQEVSQKVAIHMGPLDLNAFLDALTINLAHSSALVHPDYVDPVELADFGSMLQRLNEWIATQSNSKNLNLLNAGLSLVLHNSKCGDEESWEQLLISIKMVEKIVQLPVPAEHDAALAMIRTGPLAKFVNLFKLGKVINDSPQIIYVLTSCEFLDFAGWTTCSGFVVNLSSEIQFDNQLVLALLMGHEMSHYFIRLTQNDLNASTPEVVANATQNSQLDRIVSRVHEIVGNPETLSLETGDMFEYLLLGKPVTFYNARRYRILGKLANDLLRELSSKLASQARLIEEESFDPLSSNFPPLLSELFRKELGRYDDLVSPTKPYPFKKNNVKRVKGRIFK